MTGLPTVRVDDVMVHPRDNDLILGTHGRSISIMDDITPLQQLSEDAMKTDAQLLDIRPATAWINDIQRAVLVEGAKNFRGQNPPRGAAISYWLKSTPAGSVRVTISDITGRGLAGRGHQRRRPQPCAVGPDDCRQPGRGGRGAGAPAAAQPAAAQATGTPVPAQPGQAPAAPQTPPTASTARGGGGGGGGGGRGGLGAMVPHGSYLVKLMIGDTVVGQKTLVVEADTGQ